MCQLQTDFLVKSDILLLFFTFFHIEIKTKDAFEIRRKYDGGKDKNRDADESVRRCV